MRLSTSAIIIIICTLRAFGQTGDYRMGGRAMGMGYAAGTQGDEWSVFNNIGAIAWEPQSPVAGFSYQSVSTLKELGKKAATATVPFGTFCSGMSFFRIGDDHFSETRLSLGIGHKIRFVSLGFQIDYLQMVIEQSGTRGVIYYEGGGVAELFPGFRIGAVMQNFNRAKISRLTGEELPVRMEITLSYLPQEFLILNFSLEDILQYGMIPKAGIEYAIHGKFFLRTGITMKPVRNYFGIGIKAWHFKFDYAMSIQNYLGFNHQVSLSAFLKDKK